MMQSLRDCFNGTVLDMAIGQGMENKVAKLTCRPTGCIGELTFHIMTDFVPGI